MLRFRSSICLALAGVLVAALWQLATPAAEPAKSGAQPDEASHPGASSAARAASSGTASASLPFQSAGIASNLPETGAQQARQQLEKTLRDYQPGARSPEQKIGIKQSLLQLQRDPVVRALMVEMFFSANEPQLAHTLYSLIRDADLKDAALVEQLIERDRRMPAATATTTVANNGNNTSSATTPGASPDALATKARIMDLISDLGTQDQTRYSMVVDDYLAQMANHPDPQLHIRAATQRIWYLNQHQPHNLAAQEKYLADSAPVVRQEVYSLLEARLENQTLSGQAQWVTALSAALKADYPGASAEEKTRISALLLALGKNKATL